jgi:hypothetical protein
LYAETIVRRGEPLHIFGRLVVGALDIFLVVFVRSLLLAKMDSKRFKTSTRLVKDEQEHEDQKLKYQVEYGTSIEMHCSTIGRQLIAVAG